MKLYEVPVPQQYDVVLAGIASPRDENLYQATRAPIYVGQASTQLKIVRHRHTPSSSDRMSRRSGAPSSRESKMKRWAWTMAAGPTYSGRAQNEGQELVQAAQRMRSANERKSKRSSEKEVYPYPRLSHPYRSASWEICSR
jgi:hypothetical protein